MGGGTLGATFFIAGPPRRTAPGSRPRSLQGQVCELLQRSKYHLVLFRPGRVDGWTVSSQCRHSAKDCRRQYYCRAALQSVSQSISQSINQSIKQNILWRRKSRTSQGLIVCAHGYGQSRRAAKDKQEDLEMSKELVNVLIKQVYNKLLKDVGPEGVKNVRMAASLSGLSKIDQCQYVPLPSMDILLL